MQPNYESTSKIKSPASNPAFSAALPGSTLSMYCRAGTSEDGTKLRMLPRGSERIMTAINNWTAFRSFIQLGKNFIFAPIYNNIFRSYLKRFERKCYVIFITKANQIMLKLFSRVKSD